MPWRGAGAAHTEAVARIDARDGARFHESSGAAPSDEAVAATPRDLGDVTAFRGGEPRRGRKRPRDQSASTAAATDAADVAATSTHAAAAAEAALASQFHAAYASFCGGASRLQALPPASLWALWCCVHCWGGHASVTTRRLWRYVTHALRAHGEAFVGSSSERDNPSKLAYESALLAFERTAAGAAVAPDAVPYIPVARSCVQWRHRCTRAPAPQLTTSVVPLPAGLLADAEDDAWDAAMTPVGDACQWALASPELRCAAGADDSSPTAHMSDCDVGSALVRQRAQPVRLFDAAPHAVAPEGAVHEREEAPPAAARAHAAARDMAQAAAAMSRAAAAAQARAASAATNASEAAAAAAASERAAALRAALETPCAVPAAAAQPSPLMAHSLLSPRMRRAHNMAREACRAAASNAAAAAAAAAASPAQPSPVLPRGILKESCADAPALMRLTTEQVAASDALSRAAAALAAAVGGGTALARDAAAQASASAAAAAVEAAGAHALLRGGIALAEPAAVRKRVSFAGCT